MTASSDKKPLQSKKWIAMLIGVICSMIVFIASLVTMAINANIASNVGSLANTVVVFLATMISFLITGQSAIDWRHSSSLAQSSNLDEKREFIEKKEMEIKQNNELIDQYKEKYKSDESYKPINPETEMWK